MTDQPARSALTLADLPVGTRVHLIGAFSGRINPNICTVTRHLNADRIEVQSGYQGPRWYVPIERLVLAP